MIQYGLIGAKLGHSFSKEIHSQIADYEYNLIELSPQQLEDFLLKKDFKAVNVTIPYKRDVIPFLDEMTDEALKIGAVNCIRNDGGRLIGHNTDFDGLISLIKHAKVSIKDKKVLILGTGGTSDTAYAVCEALGAKEILKVSRSKGQGVVTYEEACEEHDQSHVIINATPCGMYPDIYNIPIDIKNFLNLQGVIDVIYNPLRTALVSEAINKGIKAEGGLYMLVAQAASASEFFLNTCYEDGLTEKIYQNIYCDKSNIVLTGMPSSGKSTVGEMIASKLDRKLYDTDDLIEKREKITIPEIFEKYGEGYFREAEASVIREISAKSGVVISTGGGAVLKKENIKNLKMNGKVFFVDRSPELLQPTDDRPTAFDKEQIMKRYKERYSIYTSSADVIVKNDGSIDQAVHKILEEYK